MAPTFSLLNLEGSLTSLEPPPQGSILLLYFFDPSGNALDTLFRLDEVVAKNADALSLLAISRETPETLREILAEKKGLWPKVLSDNKRMVTFNYGLSRDLPASVIIGPGRVVGAILARTGSAREVLMASADAFFSMDVPSSGGRLYRSLSADWLNDAEVKLGIGYASILSGEPDMAHHALEPVAGDPSFFSSERHAALGFLEFHKGIRHWPAAGEPQTADSPIMSPDW